MLKQQNEVKKEIADLKKKMIQTVLLQNQYLD